MSTPSAPSAMLREAHATPDAVRALLGADEELYGRLGAALRAAPPAAIATIARGSSDHAAHYLGHLAAVRTGLLTASVPPSLVTQHRAALRGERLLALAISQSGRSPDLVEPLVHLRRAGATSVAVVNDAGSPLARAAEWVLPLHAGPELAVPATKTFVASLVAAARLVAHWSEDAALLAALAGLPDALSAALRQDWSGGAAALVEVRGMYVLGRGPGLPLALETALKLKEACGIQAEGISAAEVRHGPLGLLEPGYPVLVLALRGPALEEIVALARELRAEGARVILAAPANVDGRDLTLVEAPAVELDPIAAVVSVFPMVEALARARGRDPDRPPHLSKVTSTR